MIISDGAEDAERCSSAGAEQPWPLPDLLDAGVFLLDDGGRIVHANTRAERLLGRAAADLLGQDPHDLLHRGRYGEALPRSRCLLRRAALTGRTVQGDEGWFERGDGSLTPLAWLIAPCRLPMGRLGALVLFHEGVPDSAASEAGRHGPVAPATSMSELERLALLAETTTTLTSTLDVEQALRELVRLVVPLLADWVVVDLITEEGRCRAPPWPTTRTAPWCAGRTWRGRCRRCRRSPRCRCRGRCAGSPRPWRAPRRTRGLPTPTSRSSSGSCSG
ncbi:PAS domain-containing protein [Thermocatellispora tengchongensis]|uniref:PAS domain-containing protein n=1 Tax=Thermocatellispora tengchongensis TaxID=1073253 RepID=UPI00363BCFD8